MADPLDLFGAWREAVQRWEKDTNAALNAVTSNEQYSQVMSQSLSLMARLQARQAEATEKALGLANLPSKADFRVLNSRLDDLERQIAALSDLVKRMAPETPPARPPMPPRTRKPTASAQAAAPQKPAVPAPGGDA